MLLVLWVVMVVLALRAVLKHGHRKVCAKMYSSWIVHHAALGRETSHRQPSGRPWLDRSQAHGFLPEIPSCSHQNPSVMVGGGGHRRVCISPPPYPASSCYRRGYKTRKQVSLHWRDLMSKHATELVQLRKHVATLEATIARNQREEEERWLAFLASMEAWKSGFVATTGPPAQRQVMVDLEVEAEAGVEAVPVEASSTPIERGSGEMVQPPMQPSAEQVISQEQTVV